MRKDRFQNYLCKEEGMDTMSQYDDSAYKIAIVNTKRNSNGKVIIEKNDEWREEKEWDAVFEQLQKEHENP